MVLAFVGAVGLAVVVLTVVTWCVLEFLIP